MEMFIESPVAAGSRCVRLVCGRVVVRQMTLFSEMGICPEENECRKGRGRATSGDANATCLVVLSTLDPKALVPFAEFRQASSGL